MQASRPILLRLYEPLTMIKPKGKPSEDSGLGLHLARELARAHGGDFVLKKEGNAFRLILPVILKDWGRAADSP